MIYINLPEMKDLLKRNLIFTIAGFSCFSQQPWMFFQNIKKETLFHYMVFKNLILGHISRQNETNRICWSQTQKNAPKVWRALTLKMLALVSIQNYGTFLQQLPKPTDLWFDKFSKQRKSPLSVRTLKFYKLLGSNVI